ncbi:MAG TPA: glutamine--tRNA ligase/YqeY domain fusion protein [Longimicrobiales bacterium]
MADFIREIISEDNRTGKYGGQVVTRFPPEPNGYAHIGHAKSICLNFGIALEQSNGRCHLRFDDTNPETEDMEYVNAFIRDIKWLGFDWGKHLYYASDYFEQMYAYGEELIRKGLAYVDSSSEEEIREARGTITEPGRPTKYRNRSIEENLDLFRRMRAGEFPDGAHVLRGKIDLASTNMLMRDPIFYRIRHAAHYRTGNNWCIYPLYDYAHALEDAIECVTHSLCTLEFDNNREIYDWLVENTSVKCRPHQYEFARLAVDYMLTSKRKLLQLVNDQVVSGWDDPRMPTIAGLRRRGVTPEAIRNFCDMVGVSKANSRVDIAKFEFAVRDDLNKKVKRVLAVLNPLKVVITNYPESNAEEIDAPYYPHDVPLTGSRKLPFAREIFIDADDFMENPPKDFFRLAPGREVRLRYAYIIRCDEVVKDKAGNVTELRCTYDAATHGGAAPAGRNVKGTIQWVSAAHSLPCEVRVYDRLFTVPNPDEGDDFKQYLNPKSLVVLNDARIEPSVRNDPPGSRYQFERVGFFCSDEYDSTAEKLVFNRTVTLRDTWAKVTGAQKLDEGRPQRKEAKASAPAAAPKERELNETGRRFVESHELDEIEADVLSRDPVTARFFETAIAQGADARAIARWVVNELPRELKGRALSEVPFTPAQFAALVSLVETGVLSGAGAKEVLAVMASEGGAPQDIVERKGLRQVSDPKELTPIVRDVVAANPDKADAYRGGRTGLLGFFVGQVMSRTGGRANPELVKNIVEEQLS